MADSPKDFRDPKVTSNSSAKSSSGIGKWIGIALAALLALLLLIWLFGLFDGEPAVTRVNDDPDATIVTTD